MESFSKETAATQQRPVGRATPILLGLAALPILIVVVATNGSYGYNGDEFYYLACSEHLAWGYVDHPPLSIALLALIRTIFGDAIWALHLLPALAVGASVFLTGLMARRLGLANLNGEPSIFGTPLMNANRLPSSSS